MRGASTFLAGDESLRLLSMDVAEEPVRQAQSLPADIPAMATAAITHVRPIRRTGVSGVK